MEQIQGAKLLAPRFISNWSLPWDNLGMGVKARAVVGHMPPLTLFVVTGLLARRSLLAGRVSSWPVLVSVGIAGILFGAIFTLAHPGPPFERVSPIFDLPGPVMNAFMSLNFVWLA